MLGRALFLAAALYWVCHTSHHRADLGALLHGQEASAALGLVFDAGEQGYDYEMVYVWRHCGCHRYGFACCPKP